MAQNLVEYVLDIKTKAAEQGLDNVVDALEEVEKELKNTQRESVDTSSSFDKLKKAGMAVGKVTAVMAAVGVAVLAAGKAAFEASKKVTDLVNELNDLSVRSGVSAKTIQALRQALLSSGQSAEGLTEILGAISGQFAQLGAEGSAVEKKFQSFGVAVRDTNGDLRSNNDILLDSIKLLQGISDSSDRSRASVALFGEAGAKLNQALAAGDFEKFLSFTEKFGIDTGPEASKAAAHFQFVLSGLETVLNGTLQKFVTATDGQNRFIQGMIKLGGIVAFTGSLIESFADEIGFVTDKLLDLLKFGIKQTILILTGPFALAIGSIINNLELFGIQVDFVNKAMSSLANFTIETVDPTNTLSNAIDKAKADMKEYNEAMEGANINLDVFGKGTAQASSEISNLGEETKDTTEQIRSLNDVLRDALGIRFDGSNLLQDFQIVLSSLESGFITFTKGAGNAFVGLGNILIKSAEKGSRGFFNVMNSVLIKLQSLFDGLSIKIFEGFSKAEGSKVVSALSNFITSNPAFTGILGALKIAEGLGQRGSTVAEIEKSVEQDIRARAKAIELGLRALPRILFKVLPPLFVEFADRVVFGFFKSIAEFVNMLKDFFRSIFTREGRQERKAQRDRRQEARGEEFRRRLEQLVNIAGFRSGGRYLPSARGGIKFTGMQDQGLAMLHRGEFVVPETGQMPQAVQRTMGMGQGGMTININAAVVESNAVDELVRQIERRFQTFGSSTSPLFGGR